MAVRARNDGARRRGWSRPLIELTPNPYLASGRRLGRDELFAAVSSAFWTALAKLLLGWLGPGLSTAVEGAILAFIGPVSEKPALFTKYILDARKEYRDTPREQRRRVSYYIVRVLREGWPTLRTDLFFHDPSYTVLVWLLLQAIPGAGAVTVGLISAVSFFAAVALASTAEVFWVEAKYRLMHSRLCRAGFVTKAYYEVRFLVDPEGDPRFAPRAVLDQLEKEFDLHGRRTLDYRDVYLTKHSLEAFNGRKPYLRFRQRLEEDGRASKQALQVMHTRSRELAEQARDLYRCFVTLKWKSGYDFPLDGPMPWGVSAISDAKVQRVARRLQSGDQCREVRFRREVAVGEDDVFVSVDSPSEGAATGKAYWLELKSRASLRVLGEMSRYIAWKLPVRGTTRLKCEMHSDDSPADTVPGDKTDQLAVHA